MKYADWLEESQLYCLHEEHPNGMSRLNHNDCQRMNEGGHGIFWAVQCFVEQRKIENLAHIRAWAIDIDNGSKEEQVESIKKAPIRPSMIIETRRGYHCYWFAKDANKDNYRNLLETRLIPFFNADKAAKDLSRVLRVPNYYHLKNGVKTMVNLIYFNDVFYTESAMIKAFPPYLVQQSQPFEPNKFIKTAPVRANQIAFDSNEFVKQPYIPKITQNVPRATNDPRPILDGMTVLNKLSGTKYVMGERFQFKPQANGKISVYVDDKPAPIWIDTNGLIGSNNGWGPNVKKFLKYYHETKGMPFDLVLEGVKFVYFDK